METVSCLLWGSAHKGQRSACSLRVAEDSRARLGRNQHGQRDVRTPPLALPPFLSVLQTHTPALCLTVRSESPGFLKCPPPEQEQGLLAEIRGTVFFLKSSQLSSVCVTSPPPPQKTFCKYFPQYTRSGYLNLKRICPRTIKFIPCPVINKCPRSHPGCLALNSPQQGCPEPPNTLLSSFMGNGQGEELKRRAGRAPWSRRYGVGSSGKRNPCLENARWGARGHSPAWNSTWRFFSLSSCSSME